MSSSAGFPAFGYAAHAKDQPLVPFEFTRRAPNPNDVVIDIKYCGICHSDIHTARNEWGSAIYPVCPGHEIVGIVREVGANVTKFKVGDKAGVGCLVNSCRQCDSCKDDLEQFCDSHPTFTYSAIDEDKTTTFGGYSNIITVKEHFALKVADDADLAKTAPLLCAGITLYSPLVHWKAGPGKKVAILGMGGLGHMGVKISVALGAETYVLSTSLSKAEDSKKFGAVAHYSTKDPKTFEELRGKFDIIVSTVSANLNFDEYVSLLRHNGTIVCVGAPEHSNSFNSFSLIMGRKSIAGSLIGGLKETQEMLDFCAKHNITADIELIKADYINEAYERILKSDVKYRFVIDCSTFTKSE